MGKRDPALRPEFADPAAFKRAGWVFQMLSEYFEGDKRRAIDFMRAHCACTIVMPTMPLIERIALEHEILRGVTRDPSARNLSRIADLHNTERRAISKLVVNSTGMGIAERRASATSPLENNIHADPPKADTARQLAAPPTVLDVPTGPLIRENAPSVMLAGAVDQEAQPTRDQSIVKPSRVTIGSHFNMLTVVARIAPTIDPKTGKRQSRWECVCDCGATTHVRQSALRIKGQRSCGCTRWPPKIKIGEHFGVWEVIGRAPPLIKRGVKIKCWKVRCHCGSERDVRQGNLLNGNSNSCGMCTRYLRRGTKKKAAAPKAEPPALSAANHHDTAITVSETPVPMSEVIEADERSPCEW